MINYDGDLLKEDSLYLSAENRAFSQGDGLVETLRAVPGKVYFWEEHYLRLMASMRILRMDIPMNFTMEFLEGEIQRTISETGMSEKAVLVTLFIFPKHSTDLEIQDRQVSYIIQVRPHSSPFYLHLEDPYEIDLYKDFFVQSGMLSNLPTVNMILKNIGWVYARENGYSDCILLNDQKNVVQTLKGNIFLVVKDSIKTPPLSDGCENSVLRKKIIELIGKIPEYTLEEASISPFELQKADEIFIADTADGVRSVTRYRKAAFNTKVAKDLLGKLNALARLN